MHHAIGRLFPEWKRKILDNRALGLGLTSALFEHDLHQMIGYFSVPRDYSALTRLEEIVQDYIQLSVSNQLPYGESLPKTKDSTPSFKHHHLKATMYAPYMPHMRLGTFSLSNSLPLISGIANSLVIVILCHRNE